MEISRNLNVGCGEHIIPDTPETQWVHLDKFKREGVTVIHDLNDPLPFGDNSFDLVLASHILEHVEKYEQVVRELHRVLKPGGILVVKVPEFPCRAAVADPDHKRYFVPESFFHLTRREIGPASKPELKGLFDLLYLNVLKHSKPILDNGSMGSYFTEIHCELICIKEAA